MQAKINLLKGFILTESFPIDNRLSSCFVRTYKVATTSDAAPVLLARSNTIFLFNFLWKHQIVIKEQNNPVENQLRFQSYLAFYSEPPTLTLFACTVKKSFSSTNPLAWCNLTSSHLRKAFDWWRAELLHFTSRTPTLTSSFAIPSTRN